MKAIWVPVWGFNMSSWSIFWESCAGQESLHLWSFAAGWLPRRVKEGSCTQPQKLTNGKYSEHSVPISCDTWTPAPVTPVATEKGQCFPSCGHYIEKSCDQLHVRNHSPQGGPSPFRKMLMLPQSQTFDRIRTASGPMRSFCYGVPTFLCERGIFYLGGIKPHSPTICFPPGNVGCIRMLWM